MLSHEVRTPLNGVLGMTSALQQTALNNAQSEMVQTVERSGRALLSMLDDILELTQAEAGALKLKDAPYCTDDLAQGIEAAFGPKAKANGIDFSIVVEEEARGWFKGDGARVRQVLRNLVSNAVKFTHEGGVKVHVKLCDQSDEQCLHCEVIDTGIGIDKAQLGALFEPFKQGDGSRTRRHGGAGLGLAISSKLCRLMGGALTAESYMGSGSKFIFRVRADRAFSQEKPADEEVSSMDVMKSLKILAAEDNLVNQRVLKALIEKTGAKLTLVDNGKSALDTLANEPFDVVLMDIQMPVMDGMETVRIIREQEKEQNTPPQSVIAVTANAMRQDKVDYLDAGFSAVVAKPITPKTLFSEILRVYAKSKAIKAAWRKAAQ